MNIRQLLWRTCRGLHLASSMQTTCHSKYQVCTDFLIQLFLPFIILRRRKKFCSYVLAERLWTLSKSASHPSLSRLAQKWKGKSVTCLTSHNFTPHPPFYNSLPKFAESPWFLEHREKKKAQQLVEKRDRYGKDSVKRNSSERYITSTWAEWTGKEGGTCISANGKLERVNLS